jgi:hypothetical protein
MARVVLLSVPSAYLGYGCTDALSIAFAGSIEDADGHKQTRSRSEPRMQDEYYTGGYATLNPSCCPTLRAAIVDTVGEGKIEVK